MEVPETRYARRGQLHIGYQVWGEGDKDILDFGFGLYISIDETNEQPQWRRYTERLAACGRVIRFDPSGVGLTDTPSDVGQLTYRTWVDDAVAVMDAAGATRAAVLAASGWTLPAFLFAAEHPERTESLVVVNASARYVEADDYPIGIPMALMEQFWAGLDPDSESNGAEGLSDLRLFAPSAADDPEFQRWWSRASMRGATPAVSAVLSEQSATADYRYLLPRITAPTLVLHRRDAVAPTVDHGRYVAEHIAGARFVALPGNDVVPFLGDLDGLVDHIQEFITGERYQPGPDRVLATILFTDMVDSTSMATRLGDRRWTQVLLDYNELVRRQLSRFGGRFVKDTGDGVVATFDAPSRAIRCALALRDGATRLAIQVRSGLHTGEIEQSGDDIRGIAVHIAARIASSAAVGEVLVSDVVADLVEGAGIEFLDRGFHELKGISRPRQIWCALGA
jgi:class 3 adenylate cyclase/pimeloyl-ACP methyl ester carboxylesterase